MSYGGLRTIAGAVAAALTGILIPHSGVNIKAAYAKPPSRIFTASSRPAVSAARKAAVTLPPNTLAQNWLKLARYPGLVHSTVSAYAYDVSTGQVLASVHPTLRVTPGSVTKLFTSAAALATLGPHFTYKTEVMVPREVAGGQSRPIYLVGGGDPWLEANGSKALEVLANQVAAQRPSVSQVIGIGSQFAPPTYGIGWPIGGIPQNYSAGVSALMAERSEVAVWVQGSSLAGQHPMVTFKFNGAATDPGYFHVINRATTSGTGMAAVRVTRVLGTNRIVVTGHIPQYSQAGPFVLSVSNPALYAASLFENALRAAGVPVSSPATTAATLPSGLTTVATHTSPRLSQELTIQNRYSINQMADNLYRELSVPGYGTGSLSGSERIMSAFSRGAGVSAGSIQVDGSGLSPLNQMSAQDVVNLLRYAATQPWFTTFEHSMIQIDNPHACGFLCPPSWTVALPAHTQIFVKPGNLTNQWNLAGYVQAENGNVIAFAILNDGTPTSQNTFPNSAVGQMMNEIAAWPHVPPVSATAAPAPVSGSLPAMLRPPLAHIPAYDNGSSTAVAVVNVATGKPIFQQNGGTLIRAGLSPRIVLDMAALQHLGAALPAVQVLAAGPVVQGTLRGALVLDGNNNDLGPKTLTSLAQSVASQGIKQINGPIEYVNPRRGFQQTRWPGGLAWEALGEGWAVPASPLYLGFDHVRLSIHGTTAGTAAHITVTPADTPIAVQNNTTVTAAGTTPSLDTSLAFNSNTFVVSGTIPTGFQATKIIAPPDPALTATQQFEDALTQAGITLKDGRPVAVSTLPANTKLVAQTGGNSVAALVRQSLQVISLAPSQQLVRALGPKSGLEAETLLRGQPSTINDWTGGAIGNYLTPLGLAQAMARAYSNPHEAPLVHVLTGAMWKSESPEQYEAVGYVNGPRHIVDAVVVMASGLSWNHHFAPRLFHP